MHHGHVIADTWVLIPRTGYIPGSNNIDIGIVIVHMHDIVYCLKSIVTSRTFSLAERSDAKNCIIVKTR